jgi:hypothetical protein
MQQHGEVMVVVVVVMMMMMMTAKNAMHASMREANTILLVHELHCMPCDVCMQTQFAFIAGLTTTVSHAGCASFHVMLCVKVTKQPPTDLSRRWRGVVRVSHNRAARSFSVPPHLSPSALNASFSRSAPAKKGVHKRACKEYTSRRKRRNALHALLCGLRCML